MFSLVLTDTISDIILTKNNSEILELKKQYKAHFNQSLEEMIEPRTFTNFRQIILTVLKANRSEEPVNYAMAVYHASELRENKRHTFYKIFSINSFKQISLIDECYKNLTGHYLREVIENELFSGWWWSNERRALLTICKFFQIFFRIRTYFS